MAGTRPTAFVVFTSPRTGSSWLIDLLDSHPRIAAYAELFLPGDRTTPDYGCLDIPRFEATVEPRRRVSLVPSRIGYLRRLFAREDVDAVGFKLMYGHPRVHRGLLPYLAARRVRAIHLVRTNALEQIVSWETSVARGRFRAHRGESVADVAVRLDPADVRARIAEHDRAVAAAHATLHRYRIPTLEATYERLRESPAEELTRMAAFLRVQPPTWPQQSSLVRLNTRPVRNVIENADEIEHALAPTEHAWMLG